MDNSNKPQYSKGHEIAAYILMGIIGLTLLIITLLIIDGAGIFGLILAPIMFFPMIGQALKEGGEIK